MEPVLEFPHGVAYNIICKANDQALRIKENTPKNFKGSRILSAPLNLQDDGQLFMIQKVGLEKADYQIVNCVSSMVFDEDSKEIHLHFGKQSSSQLFALVKAPIQGYYQYYWIQTNEKGDCGLYLEGILRYGQFDPNSQNQLFRFQPAKINNTLNQSVLIVNRMSGKALDVPEASFKHDQRIIQWQKNKRFNQRWRLLKTGGGYFIQSVLNGLYLDISGESRQQGAKVIQWDSTGNPNQQWAFELNGNGVYRIKSLHQKTLYLAIKNDGVKDGDKLQCTKEDRPTSYWTIEGPQP